MIAARRHERPALHHQPRGWRAMMVGAPFGHALVFSDRIAECD